MVTIIYRLVRTRGSNYFGASQETEHYGTYASWESAAAAAWELAQVEWGTDRAERQAFFESSSSYERRRDRYADQLAYEYQPLEHNKEAYYCWGGECDTGPFGSVEIEEDVLIP